MATKPLPARRPLTIEELALVDAAIAAGRVRRVPGFGSGVPLPWLDAAAEPERAASRKRAAARALITTSCVDPGMAPLGIAAE